MVTSTGEPNLYYYLWVSDDAVIAFWHDFQFSILRCNSMHNLPGLQMIMDAFSSFAVLCVICRGSSDLQPYSFQAEKQQKT